MAFLQLDNTLGATFLGYTVSAVLFGITSLQTFIYFKFHRDDSLVLRTIIGFIWILDALHFALAASGVYAHTVLNFGNYLALLKPDWNFLSVVVVSNISNLNVRGVLIWRIYKLQGREWPVLLFLGLLSVFIFVDGVYFVSRALHVQTFFEFSEFSWTIFICLIGEAVLDGFLVFIQYIALRRFRTGIKRMNSVVTMLTTYIINTGLLTSISGILAVVMYIAFPHAYIYFSIYSVISKLYINSLLATLNTRGQLRQIMARDTTAPKSTFDKSSEVAESACHTRTDGRGGIVAASVIVPDSAVQEMQELGEAKYSLHPTVRSPRLRFRSMEYGILTLDTAFFSLISYISSAD